MEKILIIPGRLPGMNEFIAAGNRDRNAANRLKQQSQEKVLWCIKSQLGRLRFQKPVRMDYLWVEANRKRDLDNVSSFGRKVIQDALVQSGVLKNDGWSWIKGFSDSFKVDKKSPKIVVMIREVDDAGTP